MRTGVWLYPGRPAGELLEAVLAAEEAGLDEVWIADEGPARDPFSILAAAAPQTIRITLAVGITSPLLRHPGALASTAATLDELSDGRALLGLGLGGVESLAPFGIAPTGPVAQMAAAITQCRDVLARRAGADYAPPAHAMPARSVPIWLGARGPRMIRLAADTCDGVFISGCTPADVERIVTQLDEADPDTARAPVVGRALYHSASDVFDGPTVSTWRRVGDDLIALAAPRRITSIGVNLVDLAAPEVAVPAPELVARAAAILARVADSLSSSG